MGFFRELIKKIKFRKTPRNTLYEYISPLDADEFLLWALGNGYSEITFNDYPEKWNLIHGSELTLNRNGKYLEDIPKMVDLWKKHKTYH